MATSQELLFLDPENDKNPFLLKTIKDVKTLPPNITKIEQSSVIARVKNFLPVMAAANKQLENEISKNCPDEFDIENVKEDMQYVEMNIGVYEKSSDCSSDDNCDSDEEHICKMLGEVNETNIKITTENQNCGSKMITEIKKVRNKPSNSKKKRILRNKHKKKYSKTSRKNGFPFLGKNVHKRRR